MTRKDFAAFAQIFKGLKPHTPDAQWRDAVRAAAYYFTASNPRFDLSRFYAACDYE